MCEEELIDVIKMMCRKLYYSVFSFLNVVVDNSYCK